MLGGPGIPLLPPQVLYPPQVSGVPYQAATNIFSLSAGNTEVIPSGFWIVSPGLYGLIQFLDPVCGLWLPLETYGVNGWFPVNSDGQNFRVANLTGCPIGALVTTAGSGYSATNPPSVTVSAGGSTWKPIIGGAIVTTITLTSTGGFSGGNNYTYTPTVYIAAPPTGGVQATATATLSGSAVNSFTVTNQGAGYTSAPTLVCITDPNDPNIGSVVPATATTALVTGASASSVTALLNTNYGTPLTAVTTGSSGSGAGITLTIAAPGTGTQAVATAIMCLSVTGITTVTGGTGFGNAQPFSLISVGGTTTGTAAYTQPAVQTGLLVPRPVQIYGTTATNVITATGLNIVDGGLFETVPNLIPLSGGTAQGTGTGAAVTTQAGGNTTTVRMQL